MPPFTTLAAPRTRRPAARRRRVVGTLLAVVLAGPGAVLAADPAVASDAEPSATSTTGSATTGTTTSPPGTGADGATAQPTTTAPTTAPSTAPTTAPTAGTTGTSSPIATSTTSAAASTTTTTSVTVSQSALAAPTGTAAERAASYLVSQLVDGDHVEGPYGPDLGQTADVVLALSSTSTQVGARDAAAAYLAAHTGDYAHGASYVAYGERPDANYAGPTGKAIVAALAAGLDPRSLGGFDLVDELQSLMVTSGTDTGRFSDDSAFGDYSNPIGQAFDIIALKRTTGTVPASAVSYLLTAQCGDGGFADAYPGTSGCTSNPDTTGLALQALVAAGVTDADSTTACAAAEALEWLTANDAADGSYASGAVDPSAPAEGNVNSTAYAALGLTSAEVGTAPQVAYLASVQNTDGGLPIVPTSADTSSNVLATAQALNALTVSTFLTLGSSPVATAVPACAAPATSTTTTTTTTTSTTPAADAEGPDATDVDAAAPAAGVLPRTGTDPWGPTIAGLVLLVVGGAAVAATRRPRGARQR